MVNEINDSLDQGWATVIGLEVHAQINTKTKLFSESPTLFGQEANEQVSFVDAAFPGMLPVVNRSCIEKAVLAGLAVSGTVSQHSIFARKNYFYPDLPQGYQISQYEDPLIREGRVAIAVANKAANGPETRDIRIERIHIEQDAGKSLHDQLSDHSLIDLNRSGVGLMEIVTYPDMNNAEEAASFVSELRVILRTLQVCDGNMQEGSLRVDANVSVRKVNKDNKPLESLGTRCEIKNLNSIKFLKQAILHEAQRHIKLRRDGKSIVQETRLFDSAKGVTRSMRSKEDAPDYRYFPDPDLLPIHVSEQDIARIRSTMPELPRARTMRYCQTYGIKSADAWLLASDPAVTAYFESCVATSVDDDLHLDHSLIANWIVSELFGALNKKKLAISQTPIKAQDLVGLLFQLKKGAISGAQAKTVFAHMADSGKSPDTLIKELGLSQIKDQDHIRKLVQETIKNNPDQVAKLQSGNPKILGWLVGQTIKISKGKANPKLVNSLIRSEIETLSVATDNVEGKKDPSDSA